MITALNYCDFNRGTKNEDADDDVDEPVKDENDDQECADEEIEEIGNELSREVQVSNKGTNQLRQYDVPNDKQTKPKRGGRRVVRNDEVRSTADLLPIRKESQAQMLTSQQTFMDIHPPLILPNWDQQPLPALHRASPYMQHNLSPHDMHEGFDLSNWTTSMQGGLDINSQSVDHDMVTPPSLPTGLPQAGYMREGLVRGSQQSFTGVAHPSQYHEPGGYQVNLHHPRHSSLRAPTPYEAFMTQPMRGHDLLQQRPYYM